MKGLNHLYCGLGKGKSTAATGLIVRMLANDRKVLLVSFLKDGTSSEIKLLKEYPNMVIKNPIMMKTFFFMMNDDEKADCIKEHQQLMDWLKFEMNSYDLVVLDEIIDALNLGIISEEQVIDLLENKEEQVELVMSGRNPSNKIIEHADYYTEFTAVKHPFEKGIKARLGIEY
ncbi:MAG: cob(I)yrinic acid a,c-diamide adenosyltransferase [Bacilli bacterium]